MYKDSGLVTALRTVWLPVIPSAALGSALGVWLASAFGWHPRWAAGSVTAAIASFLGTFGFTVFLLSRLGG